MLRPWAAMFSISSIITCIILYCSGLFLVAHIVERRVNIRQRPIQSRWIYVLSLCVLFTSWSFYGNVGYAAKNGLLFTSIYIGTCLTLLLLRPAVRRMLRARDTFRITSLADLLSTRYNRSRYIAALATLIALIGLIPYIAQQIAAVISSFSIITASYDVESYWNLPGLVITASMVLFTILFGVRKLDPTERHQGMVVALALQCLIKLLAAVIVGGFITFALHDGFSDLSQQLQQAGQAQLFQFSMHHQALWMWPALILIGFFGTLLMPHQFHMAVVENTSPSHLRTGIWFLPLYTVLIGLFVIPVTAAGLVSTISPQQADFYLLLLPQEAGYGGVTLLAFIGGYSAAMAMVVIATVTLATMTSNHLILPVVEKFPGLNPLRRALLQIRWGVVAVIMALAFIFAREFKETYLLVAFGLLSFTAILQLVPALIGGLFWHRGNSVGAFSGMLVGFLCWGYTLVLPAFVEQGWLSRSLLDVGPWGVMFFRPQQLFGVDALPPLTHSVFWSLFFNIGFYVAGSMLYTPIKAERILNTEFMDSLTTTENIQSLRATALNEYIALDGKLKEAQGFLSMYLRDDRAEQAIDQISSDLQISGKSHITVIELLEFHRRVEHLLAGSIGSASANSAIKNSLCYSEREATDLKALRSQIMAELSESGRAHKSGSPTDDKELIRDLRSENAMLQDNLEAQTRSMDLLEEKLEASYDDTFRLRVKIQKLEQKIRSIERRSSDEDADAS